MPGDFTAPNSGRVYAATSNSTSDWLAQPTNPHGDSNPGDRRERAMTRGRKGRLSRSNRLPLQQKILQPLLHHLPTLIEHLQLPLHHPAVWLRRFALLEHFDLRVNGVADLHRLGEAQIFETEEGDQRVVVEMGLEEEAGSNGLDERAVEGARAGAMRLPFSAP